MPQPRIGYLPDQGRPVLTEKERADIFARIVEIILADPGLPKSSAMSGGNEQVSTGLLASTPTSGLQ